MAAGIAWSAWFPRRRVDRGGVRARHIAPAQAGPGQTRIPLRRGNTGCFCSRQAGDLFWFYSAPVADLFWPVMQARLKTRHNAVVWAFRAVLYLLKQGLVGGKVLNWAFWSVFARKITREPRGDEFAPDCHHSHLKSLYLRYIRSHLSMAERARTRGVSPGQLQGPHCERPSASSDLANSAPISLQASVAPPELATRLVFCSAGAGLFWGDAENTFGSSGHHGLGRGTCDALVSVQN